MAHKVPKPKLVVDTEFVLEDPPPLRRRSGDRGYSAGSYTSVAKIVTELRENHPGRWAKVFTGGGEGTTHRKRKYEEEGFETRTVRPNQGPYRMLFVRWNG